MRKSNQILFTIFLCAWCMTGCAAPMKKTDMADFPVHWSSGFKLPELLANSDALPTSVGEIVNLMKSPWYAEISVVEAKQGEAVFSSCDDYFKNSTTATRTAKDYEMNSYIEFQVMCEAGQLLLGASSSRISYLPETVFSDDAPSTWPKELALVTSVNESKRIAENQSLRSWNDVTPIIKHDFISKTKSIYFFDGGYQELEIVGYGDVNNDGIEDLIISIGDHLEGSDYFNLRLLVLTVDSQGVWSLIEP